MVAKGFSTFTTTSSGTTRTMDLSYFDGANNQGAQKRKVRPSKKIMVGYNSSKMAGELWVIDVRIFVTRD